MHGLQKREHYFKCVRVMSHTHNLLRLSLINSARLALALNVGGALQLRHGFLQSKHGYFSLFMRGGGQTYIPSDIYNSFVSSIINQKANLITGEN